MPSDTNELAIRPGPATVVIPPSGHPSCAQERIHLPGSIQPHGMLLAVAAGTIAAASANGAALLGLPGRSESLVGRPLAEVLGPGFCEELQRRFAGAGPGPRLYWTATLDLPDSARSFETIAHASGDLVLLELLPACRADPAEATVALRELQDALTMLREAGTDLDALSTGAARGLRRLTGYERVVIYRFDRAWNGLALAEDKAEDWAASLVGLRFPASDIPAQARQLYARSPVRFVPDGNFVPVAIEAGPAGDLVIDLSCACLRSPSPVYLQIHRNLGIDGTLSFSIMRHDQLWGLAICHHRTPHHPSAIRQAAAAALVSALSLRLAAPGSKESDLARRADLARVSLLLVQMAAADGVGAALTRGERTVADLFGSTGAAVLHAGAVSLLGTTPPEADIRAFAAWLATQGEGAASWSSHDVGSAFPPWARHAGVASGVLAVFLSSSRADVLLWFRPEEPELVSWGGSARNGAAGDGFTQPGRPSTPWTERQTGLSRPWESWELEMAETLRQGIVEVVIRSLQQLTELHDQLRQSQKMEAVGQLTGGIAHDFNNLLGGIMGCLELLQKRIGQARYGDLDRYLGSAITSARRAASLTHRLLSFSRRQTLDPRSVDLGVLMDGMEELLGSSLGPAIRLEHLMPPGLWPGFCDANQLENALLNLCLNARDAMPEGGRLTVEGLNLTLDDAFGPWTLDLAAGQYVVLSVTDTGAGMQPDTLARAFEPFFTTKPPGHGTGLGLSMIYGFLKQSAGTVTIGTAPGRGTTVRLYLPRGAEGAAETAAASPLSGAGIDTGRTILVVDDEVALRMLIGDQLRDAGHDVIEAADGPEGLRILQGGRRVDLLLSDVGLPGGMNGRQLADAARVLRPMLKVLFVTGYAERAVLETLVRDAGTQVITKPFALDLLAGRVASMLAAGAAS